MWLELNLRDEVNESVSLKGREKTLSLCLREERDDEKIRREKKDRERKDRERKREREREKTRKRERENEKEKTKMAGS